MRDNKDLGERKYARIDYQRQGFLIPAPDAPWLECLIRDVSHNGICIEAGNLAVPKIFGVAFNSNGTVVRVCKLIWRRGEIVGAKFLSAAELREGRF